MIDTNKIQEAYANKKRKTADKIASFENKNSHNEKLIGSDRVQRAIVETTRLNIEHRDGHEPRVTVKNFPKKISTPDFKKIVAELKNLEKSLAPKNIDFSLLIEAVNSLKEQVAKIPTEHPEQPEPIEEVTVKNLETLKPSINKLEDAIKKLKLDPKINVESPTIPELDLTPVANIMSQIKESVLSIKIPDNSKSLNEVVKAQKAVKSAIDNLTFPVPNYVLPYKNTAGAATQVQLDSNGNVPIAGSITVDTTGLATSANQTTEQGLTGSLTETAPGTDTASSGLNGRLQRIAQRLTSLIALLPGSLGQKARTASLAVTLSSEDITALTPPAAITGFATSAKQDALLTELQLKADLTETQPVSLASVPSHAVTNAGTFAVQVTSAPTTAVTGTFWQATQPVSIASTVTTTETAPTTIYNGKKSVTTAGTRVTLASSQAVKSVTIKALSTNTGIIYVGDTSVASTNGFQLSAGETISMDIANLNTVNLDSSVSGESVTYIGVN